ncbi:MAG: pantoate--beta-alanine ligase [Lachnospiraceae bacterium]|nr:pantoate--beta-alanine ligase [Lachnospiraceae bacterium]MDY5742672.1 pantoate--beta-alanine ligase [Lachnospiraceae bacterium]
MIPIITTIKELKETVKNWQAAHQSIGLVPTMGYLHEGHKSLIDASVRDNDKTLVSIFVNPTQFGVGEDLETYPRDLEADSRLCEAAGAAAIFHPQPEEIYPPGYATYVTVEGLTANLCGKSRPTHFRGVTTIVMQLFLLSKCDRAYFGRKDAQQLAVIRRMAGDYHLDLEIIGCPIIREVDGLAKSSRNTYLDPNERQAALVLSRSIALAGQLVANGERSAAAIRTAMCELIEAEPLARIDYVQIVNGETMQDIEQLQNEVLIAIAVFIGKTRLIDNINFSL